MGTQKDCVYRFAEELVRDATEQNLTVACAESCTGGLVAGAITAVPGSSAAFLGGDVSYAVDVKERVLGVDEAITRDGEVGVVSSQCAEAMARGVRELLGADVAVSTTGIAGPGGAEPGKPVGTVWFGVSSREGERSERMKFTGTRREVRESAVVQAVVLARDEVRRVADS